MLLEVKKVNKQYKKIQAIKDFTLSFVPGIYGLLGVNGAGKTTILDIICNLKKASDGEVELNGMPISENLDYFYSILGYLPQESGFYEDFKLEEFLRYTALINEVSEEDYKAKSEELLDKFNLTDRRKNKIKELSGGTKRKLAIVCSLIKSPEIIIMDEPTVGLDPKERITFRKYIKSIARDKIIIISSHIVQDLEHICDTIIIMNKGKIVSVGSPKQLTETLNNKVWECIISSKELERVNDCKYIVETGQLKDDLFKIRMISNIKPYCKAINVQANLEELFIFVTGEDKDDDVKKI